MPKKTFLKIFTTIFLFTVVFISVFLYNLLSATGNMFISGQKTKMSVMRQFSDMIVNPSEKLKGEENRQVNILLLGCGGEGHNGGQLTDTIMIASLKPDTHEAALLSIPRDLYVEVTGTNIRSKINAVKAIGDKSAEKNGIELLEQTIEEVSGLHIDYYAQLDFQGFIKIIDSVDGIDVYLENDINDPAYPNFTNGYDPFYIKKGWHHLDGATALKVARSRHSTMGDFDRIKRQQEVIKAFRQKVYEKYSSADIGAFGDMYLSLSQNLRTDIEPKELPRFYQLLKEIKSHNITAQTVDTQTYLRGTNVGLGSTLDTKTGDYSAINELGQNLFNMQMPEKKKEAIQKEAALIAIKNGTGSLDIANTIARDLENMGFRIISSTNVDEPEFGGVSIYCSSSVEKPETLGFLMEKFSAKPEIEEDAAARADFTIILGKGF